MGSCLSLSANHAQVPELMTLSLVTNTIKKWMMTLQRSGNFCFLYFPTLGTLKISFWLGIAVLHPNDAFLATILSQSLWPSLMQCQCTKETGNIHKNIRFLFLLLFSYFRQSPNISLLITTPIYANGGFLATIPSQGLHPSLQHYNSMYKWMSPTKLEYLFCFFIFSNVKWSQSIF